MKPNRKAGRKTILPDKLSGSWAHPWQVIGQIMSKALILLLDMDNKYANVTSRNIVRNDTQTQVSNGLMYDVQLIPRLLVAESAMSDK